VVCCVPVRLGRVCYGGYVELWTGLMCFGSVSQVKAVSVWSGLLGLDEFRRGGCGTVEFGSVRYGEAGSVKAGHGGHGVESLL
jgi:hypothetical protein